MSRWWSRSKNVVRVVRMQGLIKNGKGDFINLRTTEKDIDKAFECKKVKPKAVCLEVNSMGGSPVQSSVIYERIRSLSKEKNVPVYTFAEDFAVSGGYWLSLSGDEIYVNPSTMVGSIGVLIATFGLQDVIAKLGIERRVFASNENKLRLDIFQSKKESDEKWLKGIMHNIEEEFKKVVIERRPGLQKDHPTVFTGDVFSGNEAVRIGLVDGVVGDPRQVIYNKFGKDVVIQRPTRSFWKRFASNYGQVSAAQSIESMSGLIETLEETRIEARHKL